MHIYAYVTILKIKIGHEFEKEQHELYELEVGKKKENWSNNILISNVK